MCHPKREPEEEARNSFPSCPSLFTQQQKERRRVSYLICAFRATRLLHTSPSLYRSFCQVRVLTPQYNSSLFFFSFRGKIRGLACRI